MKRFGNLTIALLAGLLAAGGIVLDLSQTGHATTANANKSEVVVVNNVDNPVISRVVGTTPVSINGTPAVAIDSANNTVRIDASTPVATRNAETDRLWFKTPAAGGSVDLFSWGSGLTETVSLAVVPAGKRMVIEHITAHVAFLGPGQALLSINTTAGGVPGQRPIPLTSQGNLSGYDHLAASELVKMFADPETTISVTGQRDSTSHMGGFMVTVDGYLVDAP
jgi:hypothetical protein